MMMNNGNPLLDDFIGNTGRSIHKWLHYFDIYHRLLNPYRGKTITVLEIGMQNGGSTGMWSRYFGPAATIIGVDIDPQCRAMEQEGYKVYIGDQADPEFWRAFKAENPVIDILIDDGGHTMKQQIVTFNAMFPALSDGGLYLCEDTHSSYFPKHGGGLRKEGTFHEYVKSLVDEMHAWYFAPLEKLNQSYIAQHLYSISVYDSIIAMEKRRKNPPITLARGYEGHRHNPNAMTFLEMRRAFGVKD